MFDPKKLKDARLKAGYTQEQIANILGIHPVSYNRWETGEREPKASYLLKLSSLLNVPIEYFFTSEDDAKLVGLKIKRRREELNLTQEKLAELLRVSWSAVSKWEIGERKPSYSCLKKLSKVLDVPVTYFFESSENREKDVFNYEILKKLRIERNLTQKQLADLLNVTQQSIAYWESGKRFPRYKELLQLSEFFKVPVDAFFKKQNESLINPQEIKIARTNKGLTQEELAKLVGVDRVTVARWETGVMKPSGESLLKLQKVLELSSQQPSFLPKSLDDAVDAFLLYLKHKGIKNTSRYRRFISKKIKEIEEEVDLLEE